MFQEASPSVPIYNKIIFLLFFERERERESASRGEGQRERERILSRLHRQRRAGGGA